MEQTLIFFLHLAAVLSVAKIGAEICARIKQPAVLGELIMGVVLGNIVLAVPSWTFFEPLRSPDGSAGMHAIAAIGVVLILFEAGLETTVREMRRVGASALLVALAGIVLPFGLGYLCSLLLIHEVPAALLARAPQFPLQFVHLFMGAALSATSVGITARVFKDLNVGQTIEARIVLGAAVIDDVLGLVLLAIVTGLAAAAASGAPVSWMMIVMLFVTAIAFLAGALLIGKTVLPGVMKMLSRLQAEGVMLTAALVICLAFSASAEALGMAAIVGAFAAGLIFEDMHFAAFSETRTIHQLLAPITAVVSPVFFVMIGMEVHLDEFVRGDVLLLGGLLSVAAIVGKLAGGWMVRERPVRRSIVAYGMIPRGEVYLIFAGIGREADIIDDQVFAAIILVVLITTLITPVLLGRAIRKTISPTHA